LVLLQYLATDTRSTRFRDGILDLFYQDEERDDSTLTVVTLALLAAVTLAASQIHDLALLLAVGGGTLAVAVSSIFPQLMFSAAVNNSSDPSGIQEARLSGLLMCFNVLLGATGTYRREKAEALNKMTNSNLLLRRCLPSARENLFRVLALRLRLIRKKASETSPLYNRPQLFYGTTLGHHF
jgi:hypothetical protein